MANKRTKRRNDNVIPIQDLLFHCLSKWHWFAISLTITIGIAVLYILSTAPTYMRSTEILIKEDGKNTRGGNEGLKNIGAGFIATNATNEIKALQSPGIMREAVKRLRLDIEQFGDGHLRKGIIYRERPLEIEFLDLRERDDATFTATIKPDSTIQLTNFTRNGKIMQGDCIATMNGDTIATPLGRLTMNRTSHIDLFVGSQIYVNKKNLEASVNEFCSKLSAGLVNEETSIVRLSIKDISTVRATEILTAITEIYNEKWVDENNAAAVKTVEFIKGRADELKKELLALDKEIANYMSRNKLTSTSTKSLAQTASNSGNEDEMLRINSQLELARFLSSHLKGHRNEVIPTNTGVNVAGLEGLISEYNKKLLDRNRLAANSSDKHPVVVDYTKQLNEMYASISSAVDNHVAKLQKDASLLNRQELKDKIRVSVSTVQVKDLQTLTRQQKVKNALYLFLLQKLEETQLTKEFTASNNRILVPPGGSNTPIAPMQKQSITLALIIGLLLPTSIIFIREITNRKVRGRKDLEGVNIPFIGEIPLYSTDKKKPKKGHEQRSIVVKHGKRDVINEAFRVLRTNLEFMNDKEKSSNVIIVTSFNPGSGKTFLTMNIAASLTLKGAKVLVIDGDMRHGSTSTYVGKPRTGLSDYLSGGIKEIDNILVESNECNGLYVIPIGSTPPNPTELLHGERFKELIGKMRKQFDYILIDCPPIDIVADTQIIEENADRTIFVIRAGLLDRDMLYELEEIYEEKRLRNISLILNGTYASQGRYGYRYGYSYSYGYGYGYGYHENENRKK
ncbi:MAG: polysaccharide biosynthesis tyrosine autokinase [Bacteroidaceae bacterium]|nr:polysaccharide biosynthesis tyrosine autokinase [Bacteroidaceae bacterium]